MTKQDFIFSNKGRYRYIRHIVFWAVWCVAFLLLFHYPVHSFTGYTFNAATNPGAFKNIQQIGVPLFILKTLLFNALLAVVVPQAAFTYACLYGLLPRFFQHTHSRLTIALAALGLLLVYYMVAIAFKSMVPLGNYVFGITRQIEVMNLSAYVPGATRDLFTSLPIVTGVALAIKIMKRWWRKQKDTEQLAQEKALAELQLLKAQVHPHFLFNTLNNIYYFTLSRSDKAPEMIKKLSGLLHYMLNECNQPLVPLHQEIALIRDYMALEKIRYGDQIKMCLEIEDSGTEKWIAPLLLLPFIENSFKHGTSKVLSHPWVHLRIAMEGNWLHFSLSNSRPTEATPEVKKGNIGLRNVTKRLQLLYAGTHYLQLLPGPESFTVQLKVLLHHPVATAIAKEPKLTATYAMA